MHMHMHTQIHMHTHMRMYTHTHTHMHTHTHPHAHVHVDAQAACKNSKHTDSVDAYTGMPNALGWDAVVSCDRREPTDWPEVRDPAEVLERSLEQEGSTAPSDCARDALLGNVQTYCRMRNSN